MKKIGNILRKINLVDLLVILVIVLGVIGAKVKYQKFNFKSDTTEMVTIKYQILISNVRDFTTNSFQVGDSIYDSQTAIYLGEIVHIEKKDAEIDKELTNGEVVKLKNPGRYDILLDVEVPGTVEKDAYYANKSIELNINNYRAIESKYAKTHGTICKIEVK